MKIFCSKDGLLSGVNAVQRAVSNKNPLPVLQGILIQAENQSLQFAATDLEMGIRCDVPAQIIEEGTMVVPAKLFTEVVRKLPDTTITLEERNQKIIISYYQSEIVLNGYDPEEFPLLPDLIEPLSFTLPTVIFKNMIRQTIFSCAAEENRPVFNGILLQIEGSNIRLVATDTHRLAYVISEITNTGDSRFSGIIPSKTLSEIYRLLRDEDEVLTISHSNNQVVFQFGTIFLISRLIEGQFPNYKQVIPQACETKVYLSVREFLDAVERASLLSRDKSSANIVRINVVDNELRIDQTSELGKISEQIGIEMDGKEVRIAFNAKFLIDALKVIDSEQILFELSGPFSPGVMRPIDNPNYIYLVLPVRTS
ncbi:DNA polymerase III subunit beta [Desulfosporosinus sp. HMP52]|uniref:Beta sliding clamp n=1 Tax=Desulfosporosinus hippei DSM 8344 TaxID=1121419 RepID=A0A1G7X1A1_9FIRM|nr:MULTISPECIES: DNA polymerase III subunit beta [Desulfosporosinus]KGK89419.1 DNA polymerase III subunit beta [Desulfosporosinus sp. HMP52]SDG77939.1 DNA polymerase-3 subunit beta [Desulfosporosinus hippei DSM 8344]